MTRHCSYTITIGNSSSIDGRPGYHYLQDAVPEVEFEIDTYWAANFGNNDPAAELSRGASALASH